MKETLSEREIVDSFSPVSSLCLLVPPLQLFSAAMWQALQQQHKLHYGKLVEFVSLVMEVFPELLSESQRTELTLGLQHMGPAEMGCKTDPALEVLLWEFLSSLDKLLLVPDLKQTVSWLSAAPSVLDVCVQSDSCIDHLRTLLRPHKSHQQLDKNETLPSLEECKLSDMDLPPSQRVVDSAKLTKRNCKSQSTSDCMNSVNPTFSGEDMKAEFVMDSSDCTGVEPQSHLNRCENVEEGIQRKSGNLMSRKQKDLPTNMKEEEHGESQSLKTEREDDESYEEGCRKENEKQTDKRMEGNATGQAAQTDKMMQNRVNSKHRQQDGEELFTLITSCLLKQPRVLIHKLENGSRSVKVSSPPRFMATPLRANGSLSLKDQVLAQKRKTVDQLERPMKLPPSSSEIRMCAEVSLCSPAVSSREQNTGQTVEESSQGFACSQCPFVHTEEVNLQQHIEKVHTEELNGTLGSQSPTSNTHQYPTPPKTLPTPIQSHTDTLVAHTCSHCGKRFRRLMHLKVHQQIHTGERPYPCSQCGKNFRRLDHLKEHLQTHSGERAYPCSQCGKSFTRVDVLKVHQQIHTGERPHQCSQCGKCFMMLSGLKKHQQTHTGERPYPCSQCGKSFKTLGVLKVHLQTHSGERVYPCSQCGKCFTILRNLKAHQRTHTVERPYLCSQCGKSFKTLGVLKVHQLIHTGERPHTCSQCGKSFTLLRNLKVHQKIHTGERPYPCSQCGKSFRRLSHLQGHLQTHTGERPHPCSQCGRGFLRLYSFKRHERTHTGEHPCTSQCESHEVESSEGAPANPYRGTAAPVLPVLKDCSQSFPQGSIMKLHHSETHTGSAHTPAPSVERVLLGSESKRDQQTPVNVSL